MSDLVKQILLKKKNANINPDSLISRNNLIYHLNDYALQEAPFNEEDDPRIYDTIKQCIIAIEQPSFEGYINALECFVYEMTKTHSELMKAKEIENQAFLERVKELVKQEKEDSKKYTSQYSSYFTNGTDYYDSYISQNSDDYYFGSPEEYDLDLEYIAQAGYEMAPNYDEDSKELFVQDMIEGTYPELLEKLSILKQQFGTIFDDYFENIKDLEKEDEDNDYSGYVDDLE